MLIRPEKYLILNKYFLNLFGFSEFDELREKLKDTQEGYDSTGRSYFGDVLIGLKPEWEDELLRYDSAIREYVEKLGRNRGEPNFNLKYFQYLAVLFTEIFLDRYYNGRSRFIDELNEFFRKFNTENKIEISPFTEDDLRKLAFWMATGSGKTLIMHINYWQILKYSKNNWDNIILITPNEGLSKQHYEELKLSGIPCKLYDGNIDNLKTKNGEVLIIDIYKLTEEKKGEGVSIDVSFFDGKNLVFIDEGHKGQKSEEQKWKKLREEIAKNGFIFEYSATFGQVIGNDEDLLEEYAKAIIFDYSYKYFYTDGYGKDFIICNMKENAYTEIQRDLLLTAGLLSFYEQLVIFEENKNIAKEYNIEKPLWIFVGSKVKGKGINSDVVQVIQFLDRIIENEDYLKKNIEKILSEGDSIFKINSPKLEFIKQLSINEIIEGIYQKVFGGKGRLEIYDIKNADGELGLKSSTGEKYFGVVNVGEVSTLKKLITESEIEVKEDHFSQSLFYGINEGNSHVNILIGSKKFIEGWNSWRVSSMGLINMGKGEGPQIIQLFGRGVRLKGKDYSLKREENPDYILRTLQTLFIFGLNADYINEFLTTIEKEEVNYKEVVFPIRFNKMEDWEEKIYTIQTKEDFDFTKYPINLEVNEDILKSIKIDLRPKITIAHGFDVKNVVTTNEESLDIPENYFDLLHWDLIYSEILNYKVTKGMFNLFIDKYVLKQIVRSKKYKIFISESPGFEIEINGSKHKLKITSFEGIKKIHDLILVILKDYIQKFYRREEKRKTMDYLEVEPLTKWHSTMFPEDNKVIIKIPMKLTEDIEEVIKQLSEYDPNSGKFPENWKNWNSFLVHLDNHLYTPLVIWKKDKEEIKAIPVKLNRGETKFIKDFKNFLNKNKHLLGNTDIFLLRNLSRKGIGFFISSGFYPDFIIWAKNGNKQNMIFVDPKGIRNLGNFNDDKIQLCASYIKEIEKKVNEKVKGRDITLILDAFIVSISSYDDIKMIFGDGNYEKVDFEKHNIIFQEDETYIQKIFSKSGVI
uniref:DEAD/DEAH box helicase n=1 Tax=Dictyoglomus thermophilum TaxID=14 RepID=A0A7C3RIK8_DICTH